MADTSDMTFTTSPAWGARIRTVVGWVAVGVTLVGLFTILTFPFDALHTRLISELARQTGAKVHIETRRSIHPLGIEWQGLRLSQGNHPGVTIARAAGILSWMDAFRGKPAIHFSVWLDQKDAKPTVSGRVAFRDWGFQRMAAVGGTAERVELQKVAGPPIRGGRAKASFRFEAAGSLTGVLEGELEVEINDLAVEQITNQGFRVPEWGFTLVRGRLLCAQRACRIGEFAGNGPDGSVAATGQIMLGQSPDESRWDVGLTVMSSPSFSQRTVAVGGFPVPAGMPLRVKLVGPLLRPQFAL